VTLALLLLREEERRVLPLGSFTRIWKREGGREGGREGRGVALALAAGRGSEEGGRAGTYLAGVKRVFEGRPVQLPLRSKHVFLGRELHHPVAVPVHVRVEHLTHGLEVVLENEGGTEGGMEGGRKRVV